MKLKDTNILSILVLTSLGSVAADGADSNEPMMLPNTKLKEKQKYNESSGAGSANQFIGISNDSKHSFGEQVNSIFRVPFSLTRLAKSPNYGYDPYFRKADFEPFERRNKLVTLLAFRKKKILPRALVAVSVTCFPRSGNWSIRTEGPTKRLITLESEQDPLEEVAEMQSPYNTVGQFWEDTLTAS